VRVLWFTAVMPPAVAQRLGASTSTGPAAWVESLRQAIGERDDLDLAIASPCATGFSPFTAEGVRYYGIPSPEARTRVGRAVSGWRESLAPPDMRGAGEEVVRHFAPDLIHVHGTENPFGLVGPRTSTPTVISLQGLLTVYERFFFRGLTSQEIMRLALRKSFVLGRSVLQGYLRCVRMAVREREIVRLNTHFMGRTDWDRTVLWALNPSAHYFHCDEVLRSPFYAPSWRGEAGAGRTIFCTSSTITSKGADCVIEALGLLHASGYADTRLRIAGIPSAGPSSEFFLSRARKHGVEKAIDWLDRLDADQLVAELLNAAVFAYPSHFDNSPNALCEALLVGAPVVGSYVGGIPSLLQDESEGLLAPPGDAYAMAGRIRRLLDDPALAAEMGQRARARALRRHDPSTIVADLLRIYREVAP
jgi:glycosyltransferase involved in cell wall biosynthesis